MLRHRDGLVAVPTSPQKLRHRSSLANTMGTVCFNVADTIANGVRYLAKQTVVDGIAHGGRWSHYAGLVIVSFVVAARNVTITECCGTVTLRATRELSSAEHAERSGHIVYE